MWNTINKMLNKIMLMKRILFLVSTFITSITFGQNVVNVTASDTWNGFMNVFDLGGGFVFNSGWGVPELRTDIDLMGDVLTLYPNFNTYANAVNSGDPGEIAFWTDGANGGNKIMEAITLVEPAMFNDQDLTFKGSVLVNTLDAAYEAQYFIKALDSLNGYADALGGSKIFDLPASGNFEVTATAAELPAGLIIQYGFVVKGINANPADENALGRIVIGQACELDLTTSTTGATISANQSGATYQWIDCTANASIAGETGKDFTPSSDGNYAVIIDNGTCSDTSDCVAISFAGLNEYDNKFQIFPNPANDLITIEAGFGSTVAILKTDGTVVMKRDFEKVLNVENLESGVYFIQIMDDSGIISASRFVKM